MNAPAREGGGALLSAVALPKGALSKTGAALSEPRDMLGAVETRSVSPVFVGRADELDTLNDALARAAAGEPQALLLGGEAGVEIGRASCRERV